MGPKGRHQQTYLCDPVAAQRREDTMLMCRAMTNVQQNNRSNDVTQVLARIRSSILIHPWVAALKTGGVAQCVTSICIHWQWKGDTCNPPYVLI